MTSNEDHQTLPYTTPFSHPRFLPSTESGTYSTLRIKATGLTAQARITDTSLQKDMCQQVKQKDSIAHASQWDEKTKVRAPKWTLILLCAVLTIAVFLRFRITRRG